VFISLSDNHWTPLSHESKQVDICFLCDRLYTKSMMISLDTTKKKFLCIRCYNRSYYEFNRDQQRHRNTTR